ncbi:macrophage mannose receptor 1-like isoform X2 [Hemibagrus wyckioides]|uniref:macrophage mannose receptor 1-like isoform X2 n=1 Tax=Hemibagrus wyckioides TaxID=337641 RepID=UPI00266D4266|nr:macrophage mannose receptor 1-like isoform X2 [Hemibagrus wyckioides]XP_058240196.1 macrophage mannose receptor 1-like isoform X2 [Hemibagrus wyckioides]XP_058240197.1 macrophage mannose receptor 1-like isoform X2 [Hemibagrus wyckioides]XP_058240198.1 macrophage mannose receptor 1-like isoform X2 [Hemibagrus wyckioides]
MKLNLFLFCLTASVVLTTLQDVRHDYILIKTPMIWDDAKLYCETNYETLAMVQTADDWKRLTTEAERHGLTVTGWMGLYNQPDDWTWTWYLPDPSINISNWATGQPDNLGGNETCTAMELDGFWSDYTCSELKPFICYDAIIGGLVGIPSPPLNWVGSRRYCLNNHRDLASPRNLTQNNMLQQFVLSQGTSWIGIYRSSWIWISGVSPIGLPWRPGYPNNAELNNNCGFLNNSLFEDKLCSNKYYFFCQIPYTVRQQVMKLKFQGDDSVFDPASQAAILQQIKQKLKALGIERETNVTWRVQPDRTIFHKKRKTEL